MSDVYDVAEAVWCDLCQEPHLPCEVNDDGAGVHFPDKEDDDD